MEGGNQPAGEGKWEKALLEGQEEKKREKKREKRKEKREKRNKVGISFPTLTPPLAPVRFTLPSAHRMVGSPFPPGSPGSPGG